MTTALRLIRAIERADNRGQHKAADYFRGRLRALATKGTE